MTDGSDPLSLFDPAVLAPVGGLLHPLACWEVSVGMRTQFPAKVPLALNLARSGLAVFAVDETASSATKATLSELAEDVWRSVVGLTRDDPAVGMSWPQPMAGGGQAVLWQIPGLDEQRVAEMRQLSNDCLIIVRTRQASWERLRRLLPRPVLVTLMGASVPTFPEVLPARPEFCAATWADRNVAVAASLYALDEVPRTLDEHYHRDQLDPAHL